MVRQAEPLFSATRVRQVSAAARRQPAQQSRQSVGRSPAEYLERNLLAVTGCCCCCIVLEMNNTCVAVTYRAWWDVGLMKMHWNFPPLLVSHQISNKPHTVVGCQNGLRHDDCMHLAPVCWYKHVFDNRQAAFKRESSSRQQQRAIVVDLISSRNGRRSLSFIALPNSMSITFNFEFMARDMQSDNHNQLTQIA